MTKLAILILPTICIVVTIQAQQRKIILEGAVITEASESLNGSTIKITRKGSPIILSYINTRQTNKFSTSVSVKIPDTLLITASYTGYLPQTNQLFVAITDSTYQVNFKLSVDAKNLKEVFINSPPVWKRGDTTFYKVDAFKEGGEKKLLDIITKIPGFRVAEDGLLTYNRKPVEKIMLEGEEIFADKIQMLLKNIPAHILNTVQALENQSDNKLLKGLGDDGKVFVNLGLKKNKLKTAFGDAESGIGIGPRYRFNPVLFSIYGKIKAGFIADWNNSGQSLSHMDIYQLNSRSLSSAGSGMMNTYGLQVIPDFDDSRYVKNNLWSNRLQLNIPVSKKIKTQFEITYIKDRQRQNSVLNSLLYTNGNYFHQDVYNNTVYFPLFFTLRKKTTWSIDTASDLNVEIRYDYNGTRSKTNSIYRQDSSTYQTANLIKNKWSGVDIIADYTRRLSSARAIRITSEYGYYHLPQVGTGLSPDWAVLFVLPDPQYNILQQNLVNNAQMAKVAYERLWRTGKRLWSFALNSEWEKADLKASLSFLSSNDSQPIIKKEEFSGTGVYTVKKIYGSARQSFRFLKQPLYIRINVGVSSTDAKETSKQRENAELLYLIDLTQRRTFSKLVSGYGSILFSQSPLSIYQLAAQKFPSGIGQFHNYYNTDLAQKLLYMNYGIRFDFPNVSSFDISLNATKNFSSNVVNPEYFGFVSVASILWTRTNTNSYSVNPEFVFPWLALKTKLTIGGTLGINERLIPVQGLIQNGKIFQNRLYFEAKRNWNKKIFLKINSDFTTYRSKFPKQLSDQSIKRTADFNNYASLRCKTGANTEIKLTGQWLQNNLYSPDKYSGFFSDAELSYKLQKRKLTFSLKLENITNQKQFLSISRYSELAQSFYSIPLVRRNVFLSARYEL